MLGDKDIVAMIAVKDLDVGTTFYHETLGLIPVIEQEGELVAFKSSSSMLNVYRSEFAGTNKATAATWGVGDDWFKDPDGNILNLASG